MIRAAKTLALAVLIALAFGSPTHAAYVPGADFLLQVAQGQIPGHSIVTKFGRNTDVDIGTEDVWNGGSTYTGFNATGAETLDLTSGAGNAGAQIRLFGLDSGGAEINEVVTLDAAGAGSTTQAFLRQWRAVNVGTTNLTVDVTSTQTSSGVVMMVLPYADNQTMIAAYTVPAGKTGYLAAVFGSVDGTTVAVISLNLKARPSGEVFQTKEEWNLNRGGTTTVQRNYRVWKGPYDALTDIKIQATSNAANSVVSSGFDILLIDD